MTLLGPPHLKIGHSTATTPIWGRVYLSKSNTSYGQPMHKTKTNMIS